MYQPDTFFLTFKLLGTDEDILKGIFSKLPADSPVKSLSELRLMQDTQSSNSTSGPPVFFAYQPPGQTFSFTRPVSLLIYFRFELQWISVTLEVTENRLNVVTDTS